jgi:curli biogenesis system outer membrane secretion channel CsgG
MSHVFASIVVATVFAMGASAPSPAQAAEPAKQQATAGQKALDNLPRQQGERPVVTIYEFRSSLASIGGRSATDVFTTALVKSGQFRVVERSRLNEGVVREKQLQQSGWAAGTAGTTQLRGAQYIFEGTVTEANASEQRNSGGINVGGMQVGGGSNTDTIAIDVRVIDANTSDILDVVSVSKPIKATTASVSGVGGLLNNVLAERGKSSPYTPDVQGQSTKQEGLDKALRACIDEAVLQLAKRFGAQQQ